MKYAVISDIHSNLEALNAALSHMQINGVDKIICCGDIVGYYSNPNECIRLLAKNKVLSILGNHDMAAIGIKKDLSSFWEVARKAIIWTKSSLTQQNIKFLKDLPKTRIVDNKFLLFHGALHIENNPEDLHLNKISDIHASMNLFIDSHSKLNIAFFGHTHIDAIYTHKNYTLINISKRKLILDANKHYLINPGSIGQPRDGDARLSYLTYNDSTREIEFHRVKYNNKLTFIKAFAAGIWKPRLLRRAIQYTHRAYNKILRIIRELHN